MTKVDRGLEYTINFMITLVILLVMCLAVRDFGLHVLNWYWLFVVLFGIFTCGFYRDNYERKSDAS